MIGLTFSLAREFGPLGISTNAIAPAFVRSKMMQRSFNNPGDEEKLEEARKMWQEKVPNAEVFAISALENFGVKEVFDRIITLLPESPPW